MPDPKIPKYAEKLLRWFLRGNLLEEVLGDLEENFLNTSRKHSLFRARIGYCYQVFNYLRPFAIGRQRQNLNNVAMIRSYVTIGWRNLQRSKVYSLINISGLAIGLACAMAIGLFIFDELSYDRFHPNAEDIYRVVQQQNQAGELYDVASTPGPMGEALKHDFPEVEKSCLVGYVHSAIVQQGNVTVSTNLATMGDKGFLKMFDFPLVLGNEREVFTEPGQVIITERMAEGLFGTDWRNNSNVIGSTIRYEQETDLKLVGVVRDLPENSHIQFELMRAYFYDERSEGPMPWLSNNYHTYIQLKDGTDQKEFDIKLKDYLSKYANTDFFEPQFYLQPLTDIYLHSDFDFQTDWSKTSNIAYVRIFFAVGLVVLLIAVFNFINLSTARAIRRAKEVGVRKSIGAYYRQLMTQFLCESILMTAIAVVIAVLLVLIALPFLNGLSLKHLSLPFREFEFYLAVIAFTLTVGILAGVYPSFYLSNFQPAKVLKGVFDIQSGRGFRQILVITQFTFTIVLVAGTIVIYQQLSFMREKNLGFDQEHLIFLGTGNLPEKNTKLLKEILQSKASIANASIASNSLIDVVNSTMAFTWEGMKEDKFLMTCLNVDPDYLNVTGMKLIAGRDFERKSKLDTAGFVVNETAAKRMGWTPEQALGKQFSIWDGKGTIIGVVQDFHFRSMTTAIEPIVFAYRPDRYYAGIMIRVQANFTDEAIATILGEYKKFDTMVAPYYSFVNQELEQQYQYEQRSAKLIFIFSVLAILVACLGLYGLATFSAERRTKEIGIRKILGASITQISSLLSKDFIFLIFISVVVAIPVGFLLMSEWLSSFAYRIELSWLFFVAAGMLPLGIAFLTVAYQAWNAARINPVNSLRSE